MLIEKFLGLSNKHDPLKTPPGYLKSGLNTNIDNSNNIRRRNGFGVAGSETDITTSHELRNSSDAFIVAAGELIRVSDKKVFASSLSGDYIFDDFENTLFIYGESPQILNSETMFNWYIPMCNQPLVSVVGGNQPAGIYQVTAAYRDSKGKEGGTSVPFAVELTSQGALLIQVVQIPNYTVTIYISPPNGKDLYQWQNTTTDSLVWNGPTYLLASPLDRQQIGSYPVPENCTTLAYHESRVYLGEYLPQDNKTVIWFSKPFSFHWFNKLKDYLVIEGEVRSLISTNSGLVIGTASAIYYYNEGVVNKITFYGIPKGNPYARDKSGEIFLYSNEGICKLNEFENLTKSVYTFPSTITVHSAIVEANGYERFINLLDDSTPAFNIFKE